jgi:hypothetical protein
MSGISQSLSIKEKMEQLYKLLRYFFAGIEITFIILLLFAPDVAFLGISATLWSRLAGTLFILSYIIEAVPSIRAIRAGSTPWQRLLLPSFALITILLSMLTSGSSTSLMLFAILPEAFLIAIFGISVVGFSKRGKKFEQQSLEETFTLFLPEVLARFLVVELIVVHVALSTALKGFKISDVPGYRYDETSIFPYVIPMLIVSTPADILLIEIMIKSWPQPVHFLHIFLSIYIIPWIYGIYITARVNPHQVNSNIVHLKQGVFGRADFPLQFVVSAKVLPNKVAEQLASKKKGRDTSYVQLLFPQMEPQTQVVEILLSQEIAVRKIFGDFTSRKLLVSIDEPAPFLAALRLSPAHRE